MVGNSSASPSRFAAMDESAVAKDTSPLSISPLAAKKANCSTKWYVLLHPLDILTWVNYRALLSISYLPIKHNPSLSAATTPRTFVLSSKSSLSSSGLRFK